MLLVHIDPDFYLSALNASTELALDDSAGGWRRGSAVYLLSLLSAGCPLVAILVYFFCWRAGFLASILFSLHLPSTKAILFNLYLELSAMGAFQLFPPPSPEGRVSTNPFRQEKKKQSADASPIPVGNLKNSGGTEGVVFQINEDTNNIQSPPRAHIAKSSSPAQESAPRSSSREKAWPERQESLSSVETWSTTLVNSSNRSFASPHSRDRSSPAPSRSPGLPMRSMFPRYDFNLPLSQQKYYPRSSNGPQTHSGPRGLTLSPASEIDRALGLKTAPASAMGLLGGNRDLDEIRYSSPAELKGLWEAANGQRPQDLPETFNLRVER